MMRSGDAGRWRLRRGLSDDGGGHGKSRGRDAGEEEMGDFHAFMLRCTARGSPEIGIRVGGEMTEGWISHTEYQTITTERRYEIRDITEDVERVRLAARLEDGMILVSTMHITSSVFVNDHESGLWRDIMSWLEVLAPRKPEYHHHETGEDNADAHLKRMLLGHQVIVPITRGALDLGPWERVHYGEFDGCRPKRVLFKAMGIAAR